jgi:hypothetical protein
VGGVNPTPFHLGNNLNSKVFVFDDTCTYDRTLLESGITLLNAPAATNQPSVGGYVAHQSAGIYLTGNLTGTLTVHSNAWNLITATNGMLNFDTRYHVSSNGYPVTIYMSNTVPFIYYETDASGGILP